LTIRLLLRKRFRKLTANSKGFSSVIGTTFMVLVMMFLSTSVFMWTLSQNTLYNEAIREKNQLESDVLSENVQVTNTTYVVVSDNNVKVSTDITNPGSLGVQFTTLWAYASNATYTGYNFANLSNVNVKGGANLFLSVNMTIAGLRPTGAYSFASWLITGRGNVVPLQKATSSYTNIVTSNTTQGIGALMMDFQNFTYYVVNASKYLNPYPSGYNAYYIQNARTSNIAFKVFLTNFDQDKRDITLTNGSELFIIYPSRGNALSDIWYIVNVDGTTGKIQDSFSSLTLRYNQQTPVYFASSQRGNTVPATSSLTPSQVPAIGAVNLALVGTIGDIPFGQNIPFVSIEVAS